MSEHSSLFREARRRHVFRTGALYVVGAWVLLQVADLAFESFGFAATALRFLWYAAIAGFPVALAFSWRYDITAAGIRKTPPATDAETADLSLKTGDFAVLAMLALIVSGIGYRTISEIRNYAPEILQTVELNSLAVLPLQNLTGDENQEYFSSGMQDTLISSLAKIRSLRVTSRTSTRRVDETYTIPMIGKALGVANIIEGSVSRDGDRIRIVVKLINAVTDTYTWTKTYDREFSDIFSLQTDVAQDIAGAVQIQLSPDEKRALAADGVTRPETYDAYLRGMFQMHKENFAAYKRGIAILTEAVENDPASALAHAGLAYGYGKLGHNPYPMEGAATRAEQAALRAIELDDTLAEAHLALAMFRLYYSWDWPGAEASFQRALELNPSLVFAHYHYAWMLEMFGDHEKALYHGEMTKILDPLSPFMTAWLAEQYRSAGMYEEAIAEATSTLEFSPGYPVATYVLGSTLVDMNRFDEAIEAHGQLRDIPFWSFALPTTLAEAGRTSEARTLLEGFDEVPHNAVPLLIIHAALQDTDQVYRWMDVAEEKHIPWYPWFITWFRCTRYLADDPDMQKRAARLDLEI